ncbi:hypothetical protein [Deferrisoma sp.]
MKVPPCGACHPGSGALEFARDPATGTASTVRLDEVEDIGAFDGDFYVGVGTNKDAFLEAFPNPFDATGVVEADCLLCHMKEGYSFGERFKQLTYRNYKWAATAAAGLGEVEGKVYTFDDSNKANIGKGTWVTDPADLPTVDYTTEEVAGKINVDEEGVYKLSGDLIQGTPGAAVCRQCHAGADMKKRGFAWSAAEDVHNDAGLECLDCHGLYDADGDGDVREHQIGKGYAKLGSVRNDLDGTMAYGCADCHKPGGKAKDPTAKHDDALAGMAFHLDKISCEGCHIPFKNYTQGELIDMSSGNQIWYLSSGDTIKWAGDFSGNQIRWSPFRKPYDPDGDGKAEIYTFGTKTSTWFGYVPEGKHTVQPYILRHVLQAYENATAMPKVEVTYVKDGSLLKKPSVWEDADIVAMLQYLRDNGPYSGVTPVFVSGETAYALDQAGTGLVATEYENAETSHDFSVSHNVREASEALGANGCTDCHAEESPFFDTYQVEDLTAYLAESYKDKKEPYAVPMWEKQGYTEEERTRLAAYDPEAPHATIVSYDDDGANACAQCHPEAVESFKQSVHYSSRSVVENENFFFPGGGKHGMLDRACALVGSNMLLNMLNTSYTSVDVADEQGGTPGQQCGSCHTNYYNTLFEPALPAMGIPGVETAEDAERLMLSGVDCLVCHAEEYDFRIRMTYEPDPYGLNMGFGTIEGVPQRIKQDRSAEALASIVRTPSDEMCLRCHEHGRTDYKRGELPEAEYDIHYKLGVSSENPCLFCHEATDHKFNRGRMVNGDLFASDYPVNSDENDASCAGCHTDRPHSSARLNDHVEKIACETCHITWTSGAETTIWGDGGFLALAKGKDNRPVKLYTKKEGGQRLTNEELWETYHQRPIYMPFSGLTSFLAQPIPIENRTDPDKPVAPRIYPFKTIINPMPFDGRFFGIGVETVDADADGVNDYSMFAAMKMFAAQYKMLGFMDEDFDFTKFAVDEATGMVVTTVDPADPKYPSYAAMAQMAAFPNMLFFDKYTFGYNWYQDLGKLAEEGKVTTWDEAYRPLEVKDMRKAVEVGMSRLLDMMAQMLDVMDQMGFQPSGGMTVDEMKAMYQQMKAMYSKDALSADQVVVMAAPPGTEMQMMLQQMGVDPALWQNYPAYSNGVTLGGHGVRKDEALMCADCHDAEKSVFNQKVEVPTYGPKGLPLVHWEFYSKELLEKAEAGEIVEDVWEAGYALASDDFEMDGPFVTASQAAKALGMDMDMDMDITFGLDGDYIAVLVPTTRLATNWEVLGYSAARIAELTGTSSEEAGGVIPGDVESDEAGSSECFVQALGGQAGSPAGLAWILAAAAASLGLAGRKR